MLHLEALPPRYAGFWIRLCAQFIDGIILGVTGIVLGMAFAFILVGMTPPQQSIGLLLLMVVALCIGWLYCAGFESSRHMGTPGKIVCGIKVTDGEGRRIGFGTATLRYLLKNGIIAVLRMVNEYLACIGFIYIFADAFVIVTNDKKQSLHDLFAGTVVVYR